MKSLSPIGDIAMRIRTPRDIGALIRDRRTKWGSIRPLSPSVLIQRKWVVDVEKGKPRAAIGLILRTLQVLGISLEAQDGKSSQRRSIARRPLSSINLDEHLAKFRKKR